MSRVLRYLAMLALVSILGSTSLQTAQAYQRGVRPNIVTIQYTAPSRLDVVWSVNQGKPASYRVLTYTANSSNPAANSGWIKVPGSAGAKGQTTVLASDPAWCASNGSGVTPLAFAWYYEVTLSNQWGEHSYFYNCGPGTQGPTADRPAIP